MNIYLLLTNLFNSGKNRAVICSGQASVIHRIAMMSKDGDWIVREDQSDLDYILAVLASKGASYRFGAPLDVRWLQGGWSSHFEFLEGGLRVRADFFSRPPRFTIKMIDELWKRNENKVLPVVTLEELVEQKKTMREKDYAIIGAISKLIQDPMQALLSTRDAKDILELNKKIPEILTEALKFRPLLALVSQGREALEEALDKERRKLMKIDEDRLNRFALAASSWQRKWIATQKQVKGLSLLEAHALITKEALTALPFAP